METKLFPQVIMAATGFKSYTTIPQENNDTGKAVIESWGCDCEVDFYYVKPLIEETLYDAVIKMFGGESCPCSRAFTE